MIVKIVFVTSINKKQETRRRKEEGYWLDGHDIVQQFYVHLRSPLYCGFFVIDPFSVTGVVFYLSAILVSGLFVADIVGLFNSKSNKENKENKGEVVRRGGGAPKKKMPHLSIHTMRRRRQVRADKMEGTGPFAKFYPSLKVKLPHDYSDRIREINDPYYFTLYGYPRKSGIRVYPQLIKRYVEVPSEIEIIPGKMVIDNPTFRGMPCILIMRLPTITYVLNPQLPIGVSDMIVARFGRLRNTSEFDLNFVFGGVDNIPFRHLGGIQSTNEKNSTTIIHTVVDVMNKILEYWVDNFK